MIKINGKLTTYQDTLENLVDAARQAVFNKDRHPDGDILRSETHEAEIHLRGGSGWTDSDEVAEAALQAGFWVELHNEGNWEIMFDWPRNPGNPPNNRATHITHSVISLSEAERRWGIANLRQETYNDLVKWKSGWSWLTTVQAMKAMFGPKPIKKG